VSALGHYIEEEGIATVAIALVRPQAERTRPPRALWVPFELGRPFGPPSDPAFQKGVILAALRLFEADTGPVLLADFPEDDPRETPDRAGGHRSSRPTAKRRSPPRSPRWRRRISGHAASAAAPRSG
jgi:hypothetical protein